MDTLTKIMTAKPKGLRDVYPPNFSPQLDELILYSGPNMDDDNGYVWCETYFRWENDNFILTQNKGCWPALNRREHCILRPIGAVDVPSSQIA